MNGDTGRQAHGQAFSGSAAESSTRARPSRHILSVAPGERPVMTVTPNEYLDKRRPEFLEAEMLGRVVYEPKLRIVRIYEPGVAAQIHGEPR